MMFLCVLHVLAAVTAGWENVNPERKEFPLTPRLWQADSSKSANFKVEKQQGAEGEVEFSADGIRIRKTNDEGRIIVRAKPLNFATNRVVRFVADEIVTVGDVHYSHGFLRYHGKQPSPIRMDLKQERRSFWEGGQQTMRAQVNTAPGMTYRKYAQCQVKDGVVTPLIVVAGKRSDSVWKNWCAEDFEVSIATRKQYLDKNYPRKSRLDTMMDEKQFDVKLALDGPHSAEVKRIDGVSRLLVDGVISAPAAYNASHVWPYWSVRHSGSFAGGPLDRSAVKLMVVSTMCWQYCSNNVPDYTLQIRELKEAMRMAPNSFFIIGWCVKAPEDFISKYHPDEGWINENGEPVMGLDNTCVMGFSNMNAETLKKAHQWPSPSSPAWRQWVKDSLRGFLRELRERNLDKRIVGVHFFGYNDQQMSMCWIDHSKCAQAEYQRIIAEPDCVSTNYDYCMRLTGQRALNEFARVFKEEMRVRDPRTKTIAIKWCQSPFAAGRCSASDISDFVRQDALDVIVCQSNYRERLPGFTPVSVLPMDSLHLHGKLYWQELDYRTYGRPLDNGTPNVASMKSLGMAEDFQMWQSMYRRAAIEAEGTRMGYWFYDMKSGWFDPPEIAADIREVAAEEEALARVKPSVWRPDVAVIVDEVNMLNCKNPLRRPQANTGYVYFEQVKLLVSSGVPYECFLAEDVLKDPSILKDKKVVVSALMRDIDARRRALLAQLSRHGTTQIFLSETGVAGGADATGFEPRVIEGSHSHRLRPEPGVKDDMFSLLSGMLERDLTDGDLKDGDRCTVSETPGVRVLARYASDALPAVAYRRDADCRRVYVAEAAGLSPSFFNRIARKSGAYVAADRAGLQLYMNGDVIGFHALEGGEFILSLPFDCRVMNMKSRQFERVVKRAFKVRVTAGESCRFRLLRDPLEKYVQRFAADDEETKTNAIPNAAAYDWMRANVPIFECPDETIERAYYFRWWSFRHHLKSTPEGYVFSEFLPDVSWAGKYNTINCAAGHHVMEGRWLRNPVYLDDYVRFLIHHGEMTGRKAYVAYLAWAVLERTKITGDWHLAEELLPDFVRIYEAWEKGWGKRPYPFKDPNELFQIGKRPNGLFAVTDDREGSENSIGGDGMRPFINSAMVGEARAIAAIARHGGKAELAAKFDEKAVVLEAKLNAILWNPERNFYTVFNDAGEHKSVRELFGYTPWYFGCDTKGKGAAWQYLMRSDGFFAPCGIVNPERSNPAFGIRYHDLSKSPCRRDGPSWPYEISLVLTALADTLQTGGDAGGVTADDYQLLLRQYAAVHQLQLDDGRVIPWIDECFDGFTGKWLTRQIYLNRGGASGFDRGKDYNHSTFCDLVLAGLCGIRANAAGELELKPLAPKEWDYWRVDNLFFNGKTYEIVYDRTGEVYNRGIGLQIVSVGEKILE